ncbi:MAG: GHKL domain-containing protein [Ignavibacteriales bacterium]|nr:GHKL domain-containing protein [Ignavibacteriales bacterium]
MQTGIVSTIGQKCRRCYSCVRECPAKAIKVFEGQALVLENRCISCGHCVKVCALEAKKIKSDINLVLDELLPLHKTIAIVAPAFVAAYPENYQKIPTALKSLGFDKVIETAFGADLISKQYAKYFENKNDKIVISTPCPAIVNYIEKYFVDLVDNLAGIVSPMIATGKYLKSKYGNETKVVFIGPCVAKKSEYVDDKVENAIDAVLTFTELKQIFKSHQIDLEKLRDSYFDPPYANLGKSYPLPGGLLKSANFNNDILEKEIIVAEGKEKVVELINDIAEGKIKSKFVDILFCEGCISGPAIESDLNYYSKREKILDYIDENITHVDKSIWKSEIYNSRNLDLSRSFTRRSQRIPMPSEERIQEILARTNKFTKQDELNCGSCGYNTCREYAVLIAKGIAEEEMCLPFLIEEMEKAYSELKETQEQLHNAEKLASIGQLAAGVAHEMNNPLATILLYSSMLKEDFENLKNQNPGLEDLKMIIDETKRCKGIVSNLLDFARQGKLKVKRENIVNIVKDVVKITKLNPNYNSIKFTIDSKLTNEMFDFDSDQLKQVIINLINNACEALEESEIKEVKVLLEIKNHNLNLEFTDTGSGIDNENLNKLFTPFFTTKKIGKGTGLGLAISYGIVKMHRGSIKVKSEKNKGSVFTVQLPINENVTLMN